MSSDGGVSQGFEFAAALAGTPSASSWAESNEEMGCTPPPEPPPVFGEPGRLLDAELNSCLKGDCDLVHLCDELSPPPLHSLPRSCCWSLAREEEESPSAASDVPGQQKKKYGVHAHLIPAQYKYDSEVGRRFNFHLGVWIVSATHNERFTVVLCVPWK